METSENTNPSEENRRGILDKVAAENKGPLNADLTIDNFRLFFKLTGGSLFYCISAALVAYGIVNVMGPILATGKSVKDVLPCIGTLHLYELALLGVLILIVSRKVVDDAISIVVLIALFLVGTSMALGSVADRGVSTVLWIGLGGIALGLVKLFLTRRFVRIPFRAFSFLGLGVLVALNYVGPVIMARSISSDPSQEAARRELWLSLWLLMLGGAGLVIIEAMRSRIREHDDEKKRPAFLQRPVMVYVFALLIVAASSVHQYSMAFTFALERAIGDFVPAAAAAALLVIEIMRHSGKRFGVAEIAVSGVPLAIMLLAIEEKSVVATGELGIGLVCYPPVILALCGLGLAGLALHPRQYWLLGAAGMYGLGVILTIGFSPERPYDLNIHSCVTTLAVGLLIVGIKLRSQYPCIAAVFALTFNLAVWDGYATFAKSSQLTQIGGLAGLIGLGMLAVYFVFGNLLHKNLRILGVLCLAGFIFDYLPGHADLRYLIVLLGTGLILTALWIRTRELAVILLLSVLWAPFFARLYLLAKRLAHWRLVILGFVVLAVGAVVSLFKGPKTEETNIAEPNKP